MLLDTRSIPEDSFQALTSNTLKVIKHVDVDTQVPRAGVEVAAAITHLPVSVMII